MVWKHHYRVTVAEADFRSTGLLFISPAGSSILHCCCDVSQVWVCAGGAFFLRLWWVLLLSSWHHLPGCRGCFLRKAELTLRALTSRGKSIYKLVESQLLHRSEWQKHFLWESGVDYYLPSQRISSVSLHSSSLPSLIFFSALLYRLPSHSSPAAPILW